MQFLGLLGEGSGGTSLAGPLYIETQKEMLYKLFKPMTICGMKISIDPPSWAFQRCHSLIFAAEDLPGLLISCQYMTVSFCTGSKFATPSPLPMPTQAL